MDKLYSSYIGVNDVMLIFKVKEAKAYSIIYQLNKELKDKGYLTTSGKVPFNYLVSRFNISSTAIKLKELSTYEC